MKKIPTLFKRNIERMSEILPEINPDCLWVQNGEGQATHKLDGTSCKYDGKQWFKRREVKKGKPDPEGFILEQQDDNTGKRVGWMTVDSADKWHMEAISNYQGGPKAGTYELLGPKIQGNPEQSPNHVMIPHSDTIVFNAPASFDDLKKFLALTSIEGLVWHHPDGRMAKIKRRDFGLEWPIK